MDKDTSHEPSSATCITCHTELKGDYCYKCGEKKIIPSRDYSIVEFMEEAFEGLMHLDSKFIKTFWLLFSKPGFLAAEYNMGRRKPYMKPIQLFVVASVIFYLAFPSIYMFFSSVENIKTGYEKNIFVVNVFHYDIDSRIHQIAGVRKISDEQVVTEAIQEAAHKSKEFLFLILPFFAWMFYLLFRRKNPYYVPHLIFTVYLFSFFIIATLIGILIILTILHLFRIRYGDEIYFDGMVIVFFLYMILSVKKVYQQGWIKSILKSMVLLVWFIALILVYRQVITIWAVNSI